MKQKTADKALDCTEMTWAQMASIVLAIHTEMKRRNPIGINLYAPTVLHAAYLLDEISGGEAHNFTSEHGPREPKRGSTGRRGNTNGTGPFGKR